MKGFCARCKEVREEDGANAWGFVWTIHGPRCKKCGGYVDIGE